MFRQTCFFCFLFLVLSCDKNMIFSANKAIGNSWKKNEKIEFRFLAPDTVERYNIFITLRNNEHYPFRNLFLITTLQFPNGETVKDTLEYAMAKPTGEWLGKGITSLKENKLWYRENLLFPMAGEYLFSIEHAMRKRGETQGIEQLPGVTDIGIKIEKKHE